MKPRKRLPVAVVIAGLALHLLSGPDDSQVKEFVKVVNMMVLVRVQDHGQPVSGLKKESFILNEDGQRMAINGFREVRRSIAARQVDLAAQTQEKMGPRFFLIYFWLANSAVEYRKTIDYFFENVFREGDRVVITTNSAGTMITGKEQIATKVPEFCRSMAASIQKQETEYKAMLSRLEQRMALFKDQLRKPRSLLFKNSRTFMQDFKFEVENSWKEFKYKHLRSNFARAMRLAEALKAIREEKWALVFYQPLQYPMLRSDHNLLPVTQGDSPAKEFLDKLIDDMIVERMSDSNFPQIKDIQEAFIAANATFHVLQPPAAETKQFYSQSLQETLVCSNWEQAFNQISKATGGTVAAGGELREILEQVIEREDVYYELSYIPEEATGKKRSIQVSLLNGGFTVFYVRKAEVPEASLVKLDQMTFSQPFLKFHVSDFQRISETDKMQGHLTITIRATRAEGKSIQYSKELEIAETESIISLKLNFPQPGKYQLVAEVIDEVTGRQAVQSQDIDVLAQ